MHYYHGNHEIFTHTFASSLIHPSQNGSHLMMPNETKICHTMAKNPTGRYNPILDIFLAWSMYRIHITKRKSWVFLDLPGFDLLDFCFVTQLTRLFMIRFSIHRLVLSMATSSKLSPKRFRKSKPSGKITKKKAKQSMKNHGSWWTHGYFRPRFFKNEWSLDKKCEMSQDLDCFRPEPMWRRFHVGKSWACVLNLTTLLNVH